MLNPLFPTDNDDSDDVQPSGQGRGFVVGRGKQEPDQHSEHHIQRRNKTIEPLHKIESEPNPAANLIRQKIQTLYAEEPAARQELLEAKTAPRISKHQQFMLDLSKSGKGLAEIQTAWHNYYLNLPDHEKHAVWQEFYAANSPAHKQQPTAPQPAPAKAASPEVAGHTMEYEEMAPRGKGAVVSERQPPEQPFHHKPAERRSVAEIKKQLRHRVSAGGKLQAKHHLQSLLFGLGVGTLVIIITLFSFFNEYLITPFIQPSRTVSATPLIIGADSISPTSTPEVIIPKINVEIPLNFSVGTTNEDQIENALEDGVVHYPTTVMPGQKGNTAFFGHSSNNIFNPGHYKFAFALLHDLVPGDTFYLTYGGKVYGYQVYDKQIVDPSDVAVLDNVPGKPATATLITCDPPGTSLHRLVVWGEQVSPSPSSNTTGDNTSTTLTGDTQLPSNGPSLWSRMIHSVTSLF